MGGYFPRLAFTRHCSILKTRMSTKLLVFVALVTGARSTRSQEAQLALANPIRKVVTMLQSMQTKVQEEGEKELALYEKYMCYCKNAGGDLQASIASAGDSISEQRKEENVDFKELMASDTAAKELMKFAKNRLNKFYNPKLYKAPPKTELSREDRIVENMSGTAAPTEAPGGIAGTGIAVFAAVSSHDHQQVAPPPPPETFGAYQRKSEDSMGVMAMIDLLIADLDKEMTEAETTEKDAQADYETAMKDAADKRTADSKLLSEKEAIKAETEADLEAKTEDKAATSAELMSTMKYIASLHAECDWLLKYFDVRKEARASEIDALGKAKAVLSGADYSLLQTRAQKFLRRSA